MRRWAIIALALVVTVCAGWWFGSPWWTLYQMRNAAEAHDRKALSQYVDYRAIRSDMVGRIREGFGHHKISLKPGDLAQIAGMIEGARDGAPTVEEVSDLMGLKAEDLTMHRDGLNQFRMVSTKGTELVFRRYGLGWKLAAVKL